MRASLARLRQLAPALMLLAFVSLAVFCYRPGLTGGFLFDDEANIERNARLAIASLSYDELRAAAASGHSGPLGRPVSMLSFALGYYFHGLSAYHYKLTNILIHALNALALGALAWLLLRAPAVDVDRNTRQWICIAAAAAWLVHPFNLTGVLYVVQRMASLATLFICCGLACYAYGRLRQIDGRHGWPWVVFGTLAFGTLAVLSKETGALLPVFCLVAELTLFRQAAASGSSRLFLLGFFAVTVAAPGLYVIAYLASHPEWLAHAYSGRDFDAIERLMTESRVVLWYLRMILLPDVSAMALLLDDIAVSRSLLDPVTTFPAIAGVIGLIALAFAARTRAPMVSFAILWFLGGHALESTLWPLEIAYEHRNYLPSFGPVLTVFYYLLHGRRLAATIPVRRLAAVAFVGLLAVSTHSRASSWSSPARLFYTDAANHPASPRNNYFAGRYLAAMARPLPPPRRDQLVESARRHYEVALALKPRMAAAQIAMICLYAEFDRPVPDLWLTRLEHILAQPKRPLASTLNAMHHLTQCAVSEPLRLPRETYLALVDTLLSNPTTTLSGRKLVAGFLAQYRAVTGG